MVAKKSNCPPEPLWRGQWGQFDVQLVRVGRNSAKFMIEWPDESAATRRDIDENSHLIFVPLAGGTATIKNAGALLDSLRGLVAALEERVGTSGDAG